MDWWKIQCEAAGNPQGMNVSIEHCYNLVISKHLMVCLGGIAFRLDFIRFGRCGCSVFVLLCKASDATPCSMSHDSLSINSIPVPDPPQNVKLLSNDSDGFLLSWEEPKTANGLILGYTIEYTKLSPCIENDCDNTNTKEVI